MQAPRDGVVQNCEAKLLLHTPPLLCSLTILLGPPGERRLYNNMRPKPNWVDIINDIYTTICLCQSCARSRACLEIKRHPIQLSADRPLEIFAVNILGRMPRATIGIQFIIVIFDQITSLFESLSSSKTFARNVLCIFLVIGSCHMEYPPFFVRKMVYSSWASSSKCHVRS